MLLFLILVLTFAFAAPVALRARGGAGLGITGLVWGIGVPVILRALIAAGVRVPTDLDPRVEFPALAVWLGLAVVGGLAWRRYSHRAVGQTPPKGGSIMWEGARGLAQIAIGLLLLWLIVAVAFVVAFGHRG